MQVKTFEATRMKDAVAAVKRELGADAVILSTKELAGRGPSGTKLYEVTAAASTSSRNVGATARAQHSQDAHQSAKLDYIEDRIRSLADNMAQKKQSDHIESGLREIKMILLETLKLPHQSLLREVPEYLMDLYKTLTVMGLGEVVLSDLLKHMKTLPQPATLGKETSDDTREYYRNEAMRWMMRRIRIAPKWTVVNGVSAVHAFVGSSGVGKTSLVAKIAAHYTLKEKQNCLLVSFDNEKVGASEQLRFYSKVIGVPHVVIADPSELREKISQAKNPDLVLVDTNSRNPRSASRPDDLEVFNTLASSAEFHLVLSSTDKQDHLDNTVRYFADVGLHSLVFSKLDESWSFGDIYNVSNKWSLPLSFLSTGASVPEDFERATRERVIERVFGV